MTNSIKGFDYNKEFFEALLNKYYSRTLDRKEAPELIHYLNIEKKKALKNQDYYDANKIDRMIFVLNGYIGGAFDLRRYEQPDNQNISNTE